jgi:hypothetical protein
VGFGGMKSAADPVATVVPVPSWVMDHTSRPAEEMTWPRSLAVEKFKGYSVTLVEVCSLRILIGAQRNNMRIRPVGCRPAWAFCFGGEVPYDQHTGGVNESSLS